MFGETVEKVLVEEKLDVAQEVYAAATYMGASPVVILSPHGGINVEEVCHKPPEDVWIDVISIREGFAAEQANDLVRRAGLNETTADLSEVLVKLYGMFMDFDATVAEINPLVRTRAGRWVAADAKVEIDDEALFRQKNLNLAERLSSGRTPTYLERLALENDRLDTRQRGADVLRTGRKHHRAGLRRGHQRRGAGRSLPAGRKARRLHRVQRQSHSRESQGPDEDRPHVSRPHQRDLGDRRDDRASRTSPRR